MSAQDRINQMRMDLERMQTEVSGQSAKRARTYSDSPMADSRRLPAAGDDHNVPLVPFDNVGLQGLANHLDSGPKTQQTLRDRLSTLSRTDIEALATRCAQSALAFAHNRFLSTDYQKLVDVVHTLERYVGAPYFDVAADKRAGSPELNGAQLTITRMVTTLQHEAPRQATDALRVALIPPSPPSNIGLLANSPPCIAHRNIHGQVICYSFSREQIEARNAMNEYKKAFARHEKEKPWIRLAYEGCLMRRKCAEAVLTALHTCAAIDISHVVDYAVKCLTNTGHSWRDPVDVCFAVRHFPVRDSDVFRQMDDELGRFDSHLSNQFCGDVISACKLPGYSDAPLERVENRCWPNPKPIVIPAINIMPPNNNEISLSGVPYQCLPLLADCENVANDRDAATSSDTIAEMEMQEWRCRVQTVMPTGLGYFAVHRWTKAAAFCVGASLCVFGSLVVLKLIALSGQRVKGESWIAAGAGLLLAFCGFRFAETISSAASQYRVFLEKPKQGDSAFRVLFSESGTGSLVVWAKRDPSGELHVTNACDVEGPCRSLWDPRIPKKEGAASLSECQVWVTVSAETYNNSLKRIELWNKGTYAGIGAAKKQRVRQLIARDKNAMQHGHPLEAAAQSLVASNEFMTRVHLPTFGLLTGYALFVSQVAEDLGLPVPDDLLSDQRNPGLFEMFQSVGSGVYDLRFDGMARRNKSATLVWTRI